MTPPLAQSADAIIGAEYEDFKDEVTRTVAGKLAATRIHFSPLDMDGFYNQAWFGLYTKLQDGQQIENRKGLLVQMTYRRAIDEYRTLHPDRQADPIVLETVGVENPIEETIDQQQQFRQFVEGMRSELNERELQAATLCYVYGLSRPEAAEQVGVRPKRMEKIMDEVSKKLRPLLASIKDGEWCEDRAVLINQFALGALEPDSDEYREAVAHLEHCSGCRRHVLGTRGMTAITIPGGLLLLALTGGAAAAVTGTAGAAGSSAGSTGGGATGGVGGVGAGVGQVAAVVAAVAAVAAGGFFVANQISDDDPAKAPAVAPASAAESSGSAAAASSSSNEKSSSKPKKTEKAKKATSEPAPAPAEAVPAQPVAPAEPAPEPAPSNQSSENSSEEFDLQ